jgi:FkbM family methyltransferase
MTEHEKFIWNEFTPEELKGGALVELGAVDGVFKSWSLPFEEQGYHVLCIEGNTDYEERLRNKRKNVIMAAISDVDDEEVDFYVVTYGADVLSSASYSGLTDHKTGHQTRTFKTKTRTLTSCLKEAEIDILHVLGLDLEGGEFLALKGFDFDTWSPKLIFAERNVELVHDSTHVNDFLVEKGYKRIGAADGLDEVFLRA